MAITNITQSRTYDVLEAKKFSKNPSKFFDEAVDNSVQYGSNLIETEINEEQNLVSVIDDGSGFTSLECFEAFHQPYHIPAEIGISRFGIGGKIFKTLSNIRIVLSIGKDKSSRKKVVYFSIWDTNTRESTDDPKVITFDLSEGSAEDIFNSIDNNYIKEKVIRLIDDAKECTAVFLLDIEDQRVVNFFKNWSQMARKIRDSYFERYHLLIEQSAVKIRVKYINNAGLFDPPKEIAGLDPRRNVDANLMESKSPFIANVGSTKIYSWVKQTTSSRLKARGIHVYRDLIKIVTIPFVKRCGRNSSIFVDIDQNKRSYRLNAESQVILIRSNSDEKFCLGETKDSIILPIRVGLRASDEFQNITSIVEKDRKNNIKKIVKSQGSHVKVSVPSKVMEVQTETAFLKTQDGLTIIQGSTFEETLNQMDKASTGLILTVLDCFDYVHTEQQTPNLKKNMTIVFNRIGQLVEERLNV